MTLADPIDLLRVHRSTCGLDDEQIRMIAEHAEVVCLEEDEVIHRPDDHVQALLLVLGGRLRLSVVLPGGGEKTILYHGPDEQFGLLGLAQDEPFPVNVVAEQQAILLRIPAASAEQVMGELPQRRGGQDFLRVRRKPTGHTDRTDEGPGWNGSRGADANSSGPQYSVNWRKRRRHRHRTGCLQDSVDRFQRASETAKFGRTAAEEAMPELRRVLNDTDPQLFVG